MTLSEENFENTNPNFSKVTFIVTPGVLTITDGTTPPDEPVPDNLVVTKTAESKAYALGDTVTFTVTATNIYADARTITLEEIEGVTLAQSSFNAAGGQTVTTTASYTITEEDILKGSFTNTVKATVGNITKTAEATVNTEDPDGHLTVKKETTSETPEGGYKLGDTVSYKITATNDGNLTLTNITVTDERTGLSEQLASLAPGESKEYTTSTTVTEADILSGHIINDATAKGTSPDPDKPDVPVDPGHTDDEPEKKNPQLTVKKETTSTPAKGSAYAPGETITYKITVTNDGNVTISGIEVADDLTGDAWTIESLAPNAEQVFTASYTVTEADTEAGQVVNNATAKGKDPEEDPTKGDDTEPAAVKHMLTINYVYENGTQAAETKKLYYDEGESYNVTSPTIYGYTPDQARVSGKMGDKNVEVTVTYTRTIFSVRVIYRFLDGSTAFPDYVGDYAVGDPYTVVSPTLDGFTTAFGSFSGTMPNRDVIHFEFYIPTPPTIVPEGPEGTTVTTIDDYGTPLGIPNVSMNAGEAIE
jgi:hypothetical protein